MDPQNLGEDYRNQDYMPVDSAYTVPTFNASMTIPEIDTFRRRLIENIANLKLQKHRFRNDDFTQLSNYHNYALQILNNMVNIKKVEYSDPYNQGMRSVTGGQAQPGIETLNPYVGKLKVIYKRDGTTEIISQDAYAQKAKQEWQTQFDENLINPPVYSLPPNNCWAPNTQRQA